jgi:hypothetical protein
MELSTLCSSIYLNSMVILCKVFTRSIVILGPPEKIETISSDFASKGSC